MLMCLSYLHLFNMQELQSDWQANQCSESAQSAQQEPSEMWQ